MCCKRCRWKFSSATTNVNALRTRANGPSVTQGDLNLNFILDERAKELHQGHRRTDLVCFGKFWRKLFMALKGNVPGGSQRSLQRFIPIPATALASINTKPWILII
jgi:hypothetical protein